MKTSIITANMVTTTIIMATTTTGMIIIIMTMITSIIIRTRCNLIDTVIAGTHDHD